VFRISFFYTISVIDYQDVKSPEKQKDKKSSDESSSEEESSEDEKSKKSTQEVVNETVPGYYM